MFRSRDARLLEAIDRGLRDIGPGLSAHVTDSPPIVGAALLGLDAVGADEEAARRIRAELSVAVDRCEANAVAGDPADAYLEVE
jgi:hypothetical protein